MKIIEWLIRILFWLQAFTGTFIVFGFIAFIVYTKTENRFVSIILLFLGFLSGVFVAELITRKYGLETFFARIYGSNKMDRKNQ